MSGTTVKKSDASVSDFHSIRMIQVRFPHKAASLSFEREVKFLFILNNILYSKFIRTSKERCDQGIVADGSTAAYSMTGSSRFKSLQYPQRLKIINNFSHLSAA